MNSLHAAMLRNWVKWGSSYGFQDRVCGSCWMQRLHGIIGHPPQQVYPLHGPQFITNWKLIPKPLHPTP